MPGLNHIVVVGRVVFDDFKLSYTKNGHAFTRIVLAYNDAYMGSKVRQTHYVRVWAFGRTAEVICEYMKKGKGILVEGRLQNESWIDSVTGKRFYDNVVIAQHIRMLPGREGLGYDIPGTRYERAQGEFGGPSEDG